MTGAESSGYALQGLRYAEPDVCAWLQDLTFSSTASESAPASSNAKRNAAIAVPTVIGGVAVIGAHGLCNKREEKDLSCRQS